MNESGTRVTFDCYLRASTIAGPLDDIVETLHEHERCGTIDELSVTVWPNRIRLTEETERDSILDRYCQFRAWADKNGVSLEPAFTLEERMTLVCDDPQTVLNLPALCLAISVDGDLVSVVPHSTETTTYTIEDALADIETARPAGAGLLESLPTPRPLGDSDTTVRRTTGQRTESRGLIQH